MKTIRTLLTIALLAGAVSAYAQAQFGPPLRISVPFSFTVENQSFPAGNYVISSIQMESRDVIQLRSADSKHATFVRTHPTYEVNRAAHTELIFEHYGTMYFLRQIRTQGDATGRELLLSNSGKELAQNGSASNIAIIIASAKFPH